ncbi:SDR family NAD(P)-dependent oxidoreductase [Microbacterium sp. J1-1]|uniref:SDR family NAD(P)-dependent oxidoreductase n=1 Tax=Microbacterium sp. J1-1 TaxID=2992441 RepID=UPI002114082C|nr:SDR family oxidoreductase [Microbacterium sp. J1-1]UUE19375.1 SDR family oxidoreductase [Microbacterium sp. J1-1]
MSGTVAIVTGGSRGIGAAVVRRLARAGRHVFLVYSHNEDDAAATAQQYATNTAKVIPFKCNIAVPDAPRLIFRRASELGTPVVLVNNAGITGRISTLEGADEDDIQQAVDVNLTATIMLCREAMRHWADLRDEMPRSIVNVSSIAAKTGAPGEYVWYAAAKAGVNALTTGLALEAARHGIRVNAVSPGTTATTIHAKAGRPNRAAEVGERSPMGRPATPDEIAAAVEWLTSAEASYVNGAILDVTGGTR